jgi:hypothetical protein
MSFSVLLKLLPSEAIYLSVPQMSGCPQMSGDRFVAGPPVNAPRRAVSLTAQSGHLLLKHQKQPLAHDAAEPLLENPVKILNTSLRRCLCPCLIVHGVGWFKRLLKQAMSEHRSINHHQSF